MSVLSAQEITNLGESLIFPFLPGHVTSQGYDMSVQTIESINGHGELMVGGKHLPDYYEASVRTGVYFLNMGQYLVNFEEEVNLPENICAFLWSRSTLLRMGASIQTAVWDAGYKGIGSSLLVVTNPMGIRIEQGARIGQMVFHRLSQPTEQPYDGQYQGGKKR